MDFMFALNHCSKKTVLCREIFGCYLCVVLVIFCSNNGWRCFMAFCSPFFTCILQVKSLPQPQFSKGMMFKLLTDVRIEDFYASMSHLHRPGFKFDLWIYIFVIYLIHFSLLKLNITTYCFTADNWNVKKHTFFQLTLSWLFYNL